MGPRVIIGLALLGAAAVTLLWRGGGKSAGRSPTPVQPEPPPTDAPPNTPTSRNPHEWANAPAPIDTSPPDPTPSIWAALKRRVANSFAPPPPSTPLTPESVLQRPPPPKKPTPATPSTFRPLTTRRGAAIADDTPHGRKEKRFYGERWIEWDNLIRAAATRHAVNPVILKLLLARESSLRANPGLSSAHAIGIAQFLPTTAADPGFGVKPFDPTDPAASINGAAEYLSALLRRPKVNGGYLKALQAYNGGIGHVEKGRPSKDAKEYARTILVEWGGFSPRHDLGGDGPYREKPEGPQVIDIRGKTQRGK